MTGPAHAGQVTLVHRQIGTCPDRQDMMDRKLAAANAAQSAGMIVTREDFWTECSGFHAHNYTVRRRPTPPRGISRSPLLVAKRFASLRRMVPARLVATPLVPRRPSRHSCPRRLLQAEAPDPGSHAMRRDAGQLRYAPLVEIHVVVMSLEPCGITIRWNTVHEDMLVQCTPHRTASNRHLQSANDILQRAPACLREKSVFSGAGNRLPVLELDSKDRLHARSCNRSDAARRERAGGLVQAPKPYQLQPGAPVRRRRHFVNLANRSLLGPVATSTCAALAINERITGEAVRPARAMPDQLVRQRPAHALEEHRVVGVLQHAPVSLLLDVLQVLPRLPRRRVLLAHVAEPAGEFREPLTVGSLAHPVHGQVSGLAEAWTREQRDGGFVDEHGAAGRRERRDAGAEKNTGAAARRKPARCARGPFDCAQAVISSSRARA